MGAIYFYHLTESPLEVALPVLLTKATGAGWRVELRSPQADRCAWLDAALWRGAEDSFVAHGVATGGPNDADQPILICQNPSGSNDPQCLVSVDGADIGPDEIKASARAMILFDGADGRALTKARAQWKTLTDAGCAAKYYAQDGGRWVLKTEKGEV